MYNIFVIAEKKDFNPPKKELSMIKKPPAEERKALSLQHHTSPGRIRESGPDTR